MVMQQLFLKYTYHGKKTQTHDRNNELRCLVTKSLSDFFGSIINVFSGRKIAVDTDYCAGVYCRANKAIILLIAYHSQKLRIFYVHKKIVVKP